VTGKKWRRSCHGEFDNAFGKVPWIRFDWEDRISLADGTTVGTTAGSTLRQFSDQSAVLSLCNPETGAPTGQTITHGELYAILWSLAMESAALQDEEDRLSALARVT
jgi:hypothetical protein